MILITLRTGMRRGEVIGLQWTSIDWENRSVAIRHSHCDTRKVLDTPKNNRERHIPLDGEVYEMLSARRRKAGYVFVDADGDPFNGSRVNRRLEQACTKAGLRAASWHVLRHTFASHLALQGTPLHIVQVLLGHASITTTLRYSHVAPSALKAAIEMLSPKSVPSDDFGQPTVNRWIEEQRKQLLTEAA
ncbi:site-specific integrase [Bradyrhizobium sp. CCGUVB1N3]|nr:site-specific integrase [Bradyrhizobium sp. CCGUVB1N3]